MAKITLIDDEDTFSEVMSLLLSTQGHEVTVAANGRDGLAVVQAMKPDLIICDVVMPVMSGFQVLERLRGSTWGMKIPFIFLTGSINDHEKRKAMEIGAKTFLQKPCGAELLFKTVDEALSSSGHCLRSVATV